MPSFLADQAAFPRQIHPAQISFADEAVATLARLIAYALTLALLGILGLHAWNQLALPEASELATRPGWAIASGPLPAFAVSIDQRARSRTYTIFKHPEGGRKDVFRWPAEAETPTIELEIYRPGSEAEVAPGAVADLAARMPVDGGVNLEAAGIIGSKFGPVVLLRRAGSSDGLRACLGFLKRIDDPVLQISGWTCQGDGLPAKRAMIGCMLNRLSLLASGTDPKLSDFFARPGLQRGDCAVSLSSARPADWASGFENPHLRGGL